MSKTRNLVLTWASGEGFCRQKGFEVYLKSLAAIPNAKKVVFTHDMPDDICQMVEDHGAAVMMVPADEISSYIQRDRFYVYWQYLLEHGHKHPYVLATDSKDVLFQRNPFDWITVWQRRFTEIAGNHKFLDNFVILTSEGYKHKRSVWNLQEQFQFQSDVREPFRREMSDTYVLNSGVCLGTPDALKNYFFTLWAVHMKSFGACTDQAALNYLYRFLRDDETYSVSQPWSDTLCLTGEGVKQDWIPQPRIKDGMLWFPEERIDEPYYIVHQYDRLAPEVITEIVK